MTAWLWLPEEYTLHLTQLEITELGIAVHLAADDYEIWKPGRKGKPVKTTIRRRLLEKIEASMTEVQWRGVPPGTIPVPVPANSQPSPGASPGPPGASTIAQKARPTHLPHTGKGHVIPGKKGTAIPRATTGRRGMVK